MNIHVPVEERTDAFLAHVRDLVASIIRLGEDKEATERQITSLFSHCSYIHGVFEIDLVYERYVRVSFTGTIAGNWIEFSIY